MREPAAKEVQPRGGIRLSEELERARAALRERLSSLSEASLRINVHILR